MLEAGVPAVEVMTEYVRACRQLGHSVPEPTDLHAAYTAEDGLDLQALDADHRTLAEAVTALEEALLLQEEARRALAAAWRGAGAEAAADHLLRHAEAADVGIGGLRGAAQALGELRNRLSQLIDAKVGTTQDIEARGPRTEWLSASRTVTTGAGDRAGASEMVDLQVAPFVVNDITLDWVCSMSDTEAAVRQAYRDAAAAMAAAPVGFERAAPPGSIPVAAEDVSASATPAAAAVTPAGFVSAPPSVPPVAPEPMAAPPPAAPMPAGASPLGSGVSGLSGLGQSLADMLGGLLGSGGGGLGESLGSTDDLDRLQDDDGAQPELDGPADEDKDEEGKDEEDKDEEDGPQEDDAVLEEPVEPAGEEVPTEAIAPGAPAPEPPVPTPVPEPPAVPAVAAPADPVPAHTPCEIAADELPQAGP